MGGMLTELRQKATKAGNLMGFATLEDLTGTIEALVFPKVLERVSTELMPDTAVVLGGRLSIREEEDPKLLLDTVEPLYTDAELEPNGSPTARFCPPSKQLLPRKYALPASSQRQRHRHDYPVLQRFAGRETRHSLYRKHRRKTACPAKPLHLPDTGIDSTSLSDMLGAKERRV